MVFRKPSNFERTEHETKQLADENSMHPVSSILSPSYTYNYIYICIQNIYICLYIYYMYIHIVQLTNFSRPTAQQHPATTLACRLLNFPGSESKSSGSGTLEKLKRWVTGDQHLGPIKKYIERCMGIGIYHSLTTPIIIYTFNYVYIR